MGWSQNNRGIYRNRKNIIYNLSHGNLTYFAQETKSLNGDTEIFLKENPLNYVFPIEITRIDNGFIKGKKKVLTTVSRVRANCSAFSIAFCTSSLPYFDGLNVDRSSQQPDLVEAVDIDIQV